MSCRDRLLAAIDGGAGAPVPCSFMIFRALSQKCADEYEFAKRQIEMGLDTRMRLLDLAVRIPPEVSVPEWVEDDPQGGPPLVTRAYETPAGSLTATVRKVDGWPYGDRLPLFGDYITPRAVKHLVTGPQDLAALRCLLAPPAGDDVRVFREEAARRKRFAGDHGLLFSGGWRGERLVPGEDKGLIGDDFSTTSVIDTLMWFCGGTAPLLWAYDDPGFLQELISVLEEWNRSRLAIHLETGVDVVFRRAWYEGTDFWSPQLFGQFILPGLRRDVDSAHQAGVRYAYIITTGMIPVADLILEAGVDAIVGIDPGEGKGTTLDLVRDSLGGRVALWGGVSGPLTVEEGTEQEVCAAVEQAVSTLAATGRFILSPVDNIRADTDQSWQNVRVFIDTWKALTSAG